MRKYDINRVKFYSKEDMAGGYHLSKGEHILRNENKSIYEDINDVMELYNIKKFLDNELYLNNWSQNDINDFKQKAIEYGKIVGQFMSKINDSNIIQYYEQLLKDYLNSFWELINNQKIFKLISAHNFKLILNDNAHEIRTILSFKSLVNFYNTEIREFLLTYEYSAEILLSIFEMKDDLNRKKEEYLPQNLTIIDKENIVLKYIEKEDCNLNYLRLIKYVRNKENFKISDKTRLKAKRKEKIETDKIFEEKKNVALQKHGVSVSFSKNQEKIKTGHLDGLVANFSYSLDYIKQNDDSHTLFLNFIILFEFLDYQFRIDLVHKENLMGVMERVIGISSESEYKCSFAFNLSERTSYIQLVAYNSIINEIELSLEKILQDVFTSTFHIEYGFASNARLLIPSVNVNSFERVRILAPEFESVLKQYKLFVEDGMIDFELLQMTSTPSVLKDIPSLNPNKYFYLNKENMELIGCLKLFFSDQTLLTYVEPFKEKHYCNFLDLLANEDVDYNKYEEHQKPQINYLIDKGYLYLDKNEFIQIKNCQRVLIMKDLFENEVASFYHYPPDFQKEAIEMRNQNLISFESSLFSRPEQSYFNFYLNKSEFTNGMDLRNRYLHGTQANPDELAQHEYAYYTYVKLLILVLLKIEDDLLIQKVIDKIKGSGNNFYKT